MKSKLEISATQLREGGLLHSAGRLDEAATVYRKLLERQPKDFHALYYLGLVYAQQGRPKDAISLFHAALDQNSEVAEAHNNLAMALYALGRYEDAIRSYERAITLNPNYAVSYNNYGTVLGALGRHEEAIDKFEQALKLRPDYVEAVNNIGTEHFALLRYARAIEYFTKAISLSPDFADAQVNLGNSLLASGRPQEALESFKRVAALRPQSKDILQQMADVLQRLHRNRESLSFLERALALDPGSVDLQLRLGNLLQTLNRHRDAIVLYEHVLLTNPAHAEAYDSLGSALAELGNGVGARHAFENALKIDPKRAKSYFGLVTSTHITDADPVLPALRELESNSTNLPEVDQAQVYFALGKAHADIRQDKVSFSYFAKGNAIQRRLVAYDEEWTLTRFDKIQQLYTRAFLVSKAGHGDPSRKPIFIVGMMRSGSTLIEQILASHSRVFAGGERFDLPGAMMDILGASGDPRHFPGSEAALTPEVISAIAAAYLSRLDWAEQPESGDKARVALQALRCTDKLPGNFLFLGLIWLLFPNATVIHTRRDPVDTCLSCYSHLFANRQQGLAYDLGELGRYYRGYANLMKHWRNVLPNTFMIDVDYSDLVGGFEEQSRRIVHFCGLEWEDASLDFYRTQRPVRTASMAQVRQPLYRTSLSRPRPDAETLRPLLVGLGLVSS